MSTFHELTAQCEDDWEALGHRRRHFFAHRVYRLPKCGPDGYKLTHRMTGHTDPAVMGEIVLYADPGSLEEFPRELFFDDEIVWHQQQFGLPGQVATANVVRDGDVLWSMVHLSDLVQRISRRRELKTRVEKRFKGWVHMLLNASVAWALDAGMSEVRTPTADLALVHTDEARDPERPLYERIYDRTPQELYGARRDGEWWRVDVARARERVLRPQRRTETAEPARTVCICHDVERGLGHLGYDLTFAREIERRAPGDLTAMVEVEAAAGVSATYCVVGSLLDEVRDELAAGGHALAFHSFDHRADGAPQLHQCRVVDYRLKGYRPPQSVLTDELTETNLLFHNFEWLASSAWAFGFRDPQLHHGLVRVPIAADDFKLWSEGRDYDDWERETLARIEARDVTAISLHDCYAPWWIERYPAFLERVRALAEPRTVDELAAELTLAAAL
jgi:hypothetical protein